MGMMSKVMSALKTMHEKRAKLYAVFHDETIIEDLYLTVAVPPNEKGIGVFHHVNLRTRTDKIFFKVLENGLITAWMPEDEEFPVLAFIDEATGELDVLACRFSDEYDARFVACTYECDSPTEELEMHLLQLPAALS